MSQARVAARDLARAVGGSHAAHESLLRAVLDLCAARGVPARPIHTGPRVAPAGEGTFALRANRAQRGVSDVVACLPPAGRMALLEIKTGGARRTAEQRRVMDEFAAAGALSLVVRNVTDLAPHLPPRRATATQTAARGAAGRIR